MSILLVLSFSIALSGCNILHYRTAPIQQGNIIEAKKVNQLRIGMNKAQVAALLGSPVLTNTFRPGRWNYVYYFKKPGEPTVIKKLTVQFRNSRVNNIIKG